MKGLLLHDFYMCRRYIFAVTLFMLGLMLLQLTNYNADFNTEDAGILSGFALYPCIGFSFLPTSLYSYDERSGWNRYSAVMPYTRRQYVNVKMLIGLFFSIISVAVNALINLYLLKVNPTYEPDMFVIVIGADIIFAFLFTAINAPITFGFGHKAGTSAFIVQCGLVGFIAGMIAASMDDVDIALNSNLIMIGIAVSVVLYAISWILSLRLYERKEI